jgi:hypothetical protein
MTYGYCDCLACKYCPDRGLLDTECPISWKHPEDWDVPIDVYMSIVSDIGCELFTPKEKK